jgi:hypothetical protein
MESGTRTFLLNFEGRRSRKDGCVAFCKLANAISTFLLGVHPAESMMTLPLEDIESIYSFISATDDISYMKHVMVSLNRKCTLRFVSLHVMNECYRRDIKCLSTVEAMTFALRPLVSKFTTMNDKGNNGGSQLLSYCSAPSRKYIRQIIEDIFSGLTHSMTLVSEDIQKEKALSPSAQSLTLSTLSILLSPMENDVFQKLSKNAAFWNVVALLFSFCREGLTSDDERKLLDGEVLQEEKVEKLLHSVNRQRLLDLLKCNVSILHVLIFQAIYNPTENSFSFDLTTPCSVLKSEISFALSSLQNKRRLSYDVEQVNRTRKECRKCFDALDVGEDIGFELLPHNLGKDYVLHDIHHFLPQGITKLQGVKHDIGGSSTGTSHHITTNLLTIEQYLSHLLNALTTIFQSASLDSCLVFDANWMQNVIEFIIPDDEMNCVPIRQRIRLVRLLRLMLPKITPCNVIGTQLLCYIGSFVGDDKKEEEGSYVELKETVSLLRHLYSVTDDKESTQISWRGTLNSIISNKRKSNNSNYQNGILAFLNGLPNKLSIGSFVLLKPSNALSIPSTSGLPSKSRLSNSSTGMIPSNSGAAPVVIGSDVEGIVAGLCRDDAKSGIISHLDFKHRTCELVLCDRNEQDKNLSMTSHMTVRAVKAPLSDVVLADEIGLLFDDEFPVVSAIGEPLYDGLDAITSIIPITEKELSAEKNSSSTVKALYNAAFAIRSSATAFSSDILFKKFLNEEQSKRRETSLTKLLELGSTSTFNKVFDKHPSIKAGLSLLPECEDRFFYLERKLAIVESRKQSLNAVPIDKWCRLKEKVAINSEESMNVKATLEGFSTPPSSTNPKITSGTSDEKKSLLERENSVHEASVDENEDEENENENENEDEENENEDENADQNESSREGDDAEDADRDAAIEQMAELGLPHSWCEYSLRHIGGVNIEEAINFCLNHGGDMERLIAEERNRERGGSSSSNRRRNSAEGSGSSHLLRQLIEMGFPANWCAEALNATGHNVDEALTWILTNGERLSALDDGEDDEDSQDGEGEGEESESDQDVSSVVAEEHAIGAVKDHDESIGGWNSEIDCPIQSISGRSNINRETLEISGQASGGFSSVGMRGVPLMTGKWYYEAVLITAGCLQIGWADSSFAGHCHSERGDGCGDGPSSWAYDGWRRYRWHCNATEWGSRWEEGDVVGCMVDLDEKVISFTLNGKGEEIGMGVAFSKDGFRPCTGVYACVSFNRKEKVRLILGGKGNEGFHYPPPPGYKGVGESVAPFIEDRESILKEEAILWSNDNKNNRGIPHSFLRDLSDEEQGHELFAWQHRYYGSEAAVHLSSGGRRSHSRRHRQNMQSLSNGKDICTLFIDNFLSELLKGKRLITKEGDEKSEITPLSVKELLNESYDLIESHIMKEIYDNTVALATLYARKCVLHIAVGMGCEFQLDWFHDGVSAEESALLFWDIIESSCSLHAAGWVGDAGTMAMACEVLGLTISGFGRDKMSFSLGLSSQKVGGEDMNDFAMPSVALTQFLSATKKAGSYAEQYIDVSTTITACAEACLGGDGGGANVFLLHALQNAVIESNQFLQVIIAVIRRSVRVLSTVDKDGTLSSEVCF